MYLMNTQFFAYSAEMLAKFLHIGSQFDATCLRVSLLSPSKGADLSFRSR